MADGERVVLMWESKGRQVGFGRSPALYPTVVQPTQADGKAMECQALAPSSLQVQGSRPYMLVP
jgi:hypothetical protein